MKTVLLVDDDQHIREVLADYLRDAGDMIVLTADSGEQALPILQSDAQVDVMVSDVLMPGMDGIELARRARALRPDMRVVMISGSWGLAQMPAGFNFLPKPFRLDALRQAIIAALAEPVG